MENPTESPSSMQPQKYQSHHSVLQDHPSPSAGGSWCSKHHSSLNRHTLVQNPCCSPYSCVYHWKYCPHIFITKIESLRAVRIY